MQTTILFWLASAALLAPAAGQSQPPLAARVQRLEDVEEIRSLLIDYGRTLDARDLPAYSRLFAKDGEWVGGFGSAKSPAGILALMEKNLGPNAPSPQGSTYHLLSNIEIDVHGNTATAWSRWAYIVPTADGKPVFSSGGHYDDTLVRENGHWKFKRRVAINDIPHSDPTELK